MSDSSISQNLVEDRQPITGTTLTDATVIIPTTGRPILEICLQALIHGTHWPAKLIVIDQGNNPDVVRWIEHCHIAGLAVMHLPSRQKGPAAARNRGIENANTTFVAAIDDDCIAEPDWLEKIWSRFKQYPNAVITGKVQPVTGSMAPSTNTNTQTIIYDRPVLKYDPLYTGNMGFPQQLGQKVGLFDENPLFCAAEDNDWGYRLLRAGTPIVYAPEVVVTHMDWRNATQMASVYRRYAWGQGVFYGKYLRQGDLFIARRAAQDILRGPWRWLRGLLKANSDMMASGRASTFQLLPGIVAGLKIRGQDSESYEN